MFVLFRLLNFFFWPLYCQFLVDLRILITPSYWQTKLLPSASNIINYENRRVGDIRLTDSRVLIFLTDISQIHFLVVTVHVLYLNFHPMATVFLLYSTQSFSAVLPEKAYCYVFVQKHMSRYFLNRSWRREAAYRYTHYWYSRWVNNSNWTDRNSHIQKENK